MSHIDRNRRVRASALSALVLASLALVACGGSSGKGTASSSRRTSATTAQTAAVATTTSTATVTKGAAKKPAATAKPGVPGGLIAAIRTCAQKPTKKCVLPDAGAPAAGVHLKVPVPAAAKAHALAPVASSVGAQLKAKEGAQPESAVSAGSLAKYVACLRASGVKIATTSSATGSGTNAESPEIKAAEAKCVAALGEGA